MNLLGDAGELRTGHLRVAAVGPYHVTKMLVDFNQRYPGIKVTVSTGNSQDVLNQLLDYSADVGVLAQMVRDERFLAVPFMKQPVVIDRRRHGALDRRAAPGRAADADRRALRGAQRRPPPWPAARCHAAGRLGRSIQLVSMLKPSTRVMVSLRKPSRE